jgi:peroxiredoxin
LTSNITDSTKIYLDNIDSSFIINNQFKFKGSVDSIKQCTIYTKGYHDYKIFWVDNSKILVDATKSTLHKAHISGSKFQNQNTHYLNMIDYWRNKEDSINSIIAHTNKDGSTLFKHQQIKDSIISSRQKKIIEFMRLNPDFELGPFYITFLMFTQPKQITEDMLNALSEISKNNKWEKSIKIYLEKSVDFKVGDKVVDFKLPDINGNQFTLSSFKGKYVLLEFWASWCGSCKSENPNLLKMYRKFNNKGFEIVGVTLDEKKEDWQSAIKSDTILWTTISDLKGILGEVPLTYKVFGIPMSYLVDPTGTITDVDIRGTFLEDRLNSIFKK